KPCAAHPEITRDSSPVAQNDSFKRAGAPLALQISGLELLREAAHSGLPKLSTAAYFAAFGAGAPFFLAAHRALIAAASFALPSGVRPPFFLVVAFRPLVAL